MNRAPIGIFDSGIGGLTVVKEIEKRLTFEDIIYFGDTARVPYGSKSDEIIKGFSLQNSLFLLKFNVKLIVIACNTASAVALDYLKSLFKVPIIGVIESGVVSALNKSKTKRIGVIGTYSTINKDAYGRLLGEKNQSAEIFSVPCPLFVPIAEEGIADEKFVDLIVEKYLSQLKDKNIDTLILGCTHYPILKKPIKKFIGENIELVDSAEETAKVVERILSINSIKNGEKAKGKTHFFISDIPYRFREMGSRFLGREISKVAAVHQDVFGNYYT